MYKRQEDDDDNGVGNVCDEVGIGEAAKAPLLEAHPNPTTGLLRFTSMPSSAREALVYDAMGALQLRLVIAPVLDLGHLAQGTYALVLVDGAAHPVGRIRVVRF